MRKAKEQKVRVLARRVARELRTEELNQIRGGGTSYYGTGGCDALGRGGDARAGDCVDGADTFVC